jgi:pimeloyl-ACP methyl ester carboxylesterase
MTSDLHVRDLRLKAIGAGAPVLVLLHGLGVNGAVWDPFLAHLKGWPGRVIIPDLRGHGRSPHAPRYSDEAHAADVAALVSDESDVHVIGHSMGGMVGLVLSNGRYAVDVTAVFAFAVKTAWTATELAGLSEYAQKPARRFASREEAVARFLRTSSLEGLVAVDSCVVEAGIARDGEGFRLAADPRAVLVAGTSAAANYRASTARRWLACGTMDPLVTLDQLRAIEPSAIALGDYGHNVHVEDPAALFAAIPFLHCNGA